MPTTRTSVLHGREHVRGRTVWIYHGSSVNLAEKGNLKWTAKGEG